MNRPKTFFLKLACVLASIAVNVIVAMWVFGLFPTLTELRMHKVRTGMTESETASLLGEPQNVITNQDVVVWMYDTWRRHAEPYVVFDQNHRVKAFGTED